MIGLNRDNAETRAAKRQANPAIGFGSSFAGGMAVFGLGGHWLDGKTGHESLFTLIGIGLGLLYGAWELWKLIALSNQQAAGKKTTPDDMETKPNDPAK